MLLLQAHDESVPRSHRPIPYFVRINTLAVAQIVPRSLAGPLAVIALGAGALALWIARGAGMRRITEA